EVSMNVLAAIVKGSSVVGINQGDSVPREAIPALVQLHQEGRFPFDELIRVYAFEDIEQAVRDAESGTVVKPVLRMPASA
ncbi:MAG: aryl-alcohol dehydrogenase, partial [Solirubrobacteraceae bacterium]|nr:aryl-alcohol dehydrogenase [Solirubrobacteraceae bacterium]